MKSLSAHNATATDSPNVDVIRLVTIAFSGLTLYLSDRTWGTGAGRCVYNGQIYEPLVISWDTIDSGVIDPVTYETGDSKTSFVIDNSVPVGGANSFSRLFSTYDPHYATVTISEIFYGASIADDLIDIFKGQIEDVLDMSPDRVTVTVTGYEQGINNKFSHEIVEDTTYTDADPDDIGKMLPLVYGSAKKAPFRAISAGALTTLSEDITTASTTLKMTDASRFSATGTVLIDEEQIAYTGVTGDSLTGCTRAQNGTTAVSHNRGAMIGEIKTEYVYALGHAVKAINDVYVNGIKQESDQYTAYTGQTGDEHATYTGRAVISWGSWPQIKRDVDIAGSSSGGYELYREATNIPCGQVEIIDGLDQIASYDETTTITFQAAPSGDLTEIYVEYDFEFREFGTVEGDYDFYLDGTHVASLIDGTFEQYVTSPLRVKKTEWPVSATKSKTYRGPGMTGIAFTVLSAKAYATSTESDLTQRGSSTDKDASNCPVGKFTSQSNVDDSTTITFPDAPSGNLSDIEITYSWDVQVWGDMIELGTSLTLTIDGVNVAVVDTDGTVTSLMPGTFTVLKTDWATSVTKTKSIMGEWRRGVALIVRSAVQSCFTDDYSGDIVLTGNSMADSVIGGLVSADVDGYQDDGSGTYTGTPAALIERPDHIFKHILIDRCGLTASEVDDTAYTAAGTVYDNRSFALGFVIEEKPSVPALLNRIAYQSRSIQWWEAGVHHIYAIPTTETTDLTIDSHRVDLNQIWPSYTDRAAIYNTLSATYHRDWSGFEDDVTADRAIVLSADADSVTKYGTLKTELSFPYVTTSGHADFVINWVRHDWANPRLVIELVGGYYLTQVERGDTILLSERPVVSGTPTEMSDATVGLVTLATDQFRVLEVTRRPDCAIQISAVKIGDLEEYLVTYDGNGNDAGAVPTDANYYITGKAVTVIGNTGTLTRVGYTWTCWNTADDGSGTDYNADDTFNISAATTLYAKWTLITCPEFDEQVVLSDQVYNHSDKTSQDDDLIKQVFGG